MSLRVYQGREPVVDATAFVDPSAVVIGDVELGAGVSVWPLCVLRGDVQTIRVGARSNIQDGSIVHVTHDGPYSPGGFATHIGEEVTVGHRALLHACTVESRCLIGMGAIVMDGALVGESSIVGAGSLVPPGKQLAGGFLYVGSPVKQVRPLNDREREFLGYSAGHYVRLAGRHRKDQG